MSRQTPDIKMHRIVSTEDVTKYHSPSGLPPNVNAGWINSAGSWSTYITLIAFTRLVFWMMNISDEIAWTLTNLLHTVITFSVMHWIKGAPFSSGKYDGLTFWEQIDDGFQFTSTRKFLILVPLILFLLTIDIARFDPFLLTFNVVVSSLIIIPKLPFMDKIRIFGINN